MAYKTFVAGEEALATDVNSYLMSQSVSRFATAAARTSGLTAPVLNQLSMLDTAPGVVQYWTGSAWVDLVNSNWQAYTSTWSAPGGGIAVGNGSLVARYALFGKTCFFRIFLTFGSTTNGSNGAYTFTVPFAGQSSANQWVLAAYYISGGVVMTGAAIIPAGTANLLPFCMANANDCRQYQTRNADATNNAGTGIPTIPGGFPFVNGSYMSFSGCYETA